MPQKEINPCHSKSFHGIPNEELSEPLTRRPIQSQHGPPEHNTESCRAHNINEESCHLYINPDGLLLGGQTYRKKRKAIIPPETEHADYELETLGKKQISPESSSMGKRATNREVTFMEDIYSSKLKNVDVHKSRARREALIQETSRKLASCSPPAKERSSNQEFEQRHIKKGEMDSTGENQVDFQKNMVKIFSTKNAPVLRRSRSNNKISNRIVSLCRSKSLNCALKVQRCLGASQSKSMVCVNDIYDRNTPSHIQRYCLEQIPQNKKSSDTTGDPLPDSKKSHCVIQLDNSQTDSACYVNGTVELNVNRHAFLSGSDRSLLTDQNKSYHNQQNFREKLYLFLKCIALMILGAIVGAGMHSLFACAHEC